MPQFYGARNMQGLPSRHPPSSSRPAGSMRNPGLRPTIKPCIAAIFPLLAPLECLLRPSFTPLVITSTAPNFEPPNNNSIYAFGLTEQPHLGSFAGGTKEGQVVPTTQG